jgi:hypothetical protein
MSEVPSDQRRTGTRNVVMCSTLARQNEAATLGKRQQAFELPAAELAGTWVY